MIVEPQPNEPLWNLTEQEEAELLDKLVSDGNVKMRAVGVIARFFAPESGGRRTPYVVKSDLRERMKVARALLKAMHDDTDLVVVSKTDLDSYVASVARRAREKERCRAEQ